MATEKQTQANRNNAQKSTGPRTEEGKAQSSQNARKHGLLARNAVIPGEDPAEFEAQLAALEADIQPQGALEHELVRQTADAQWRMRRLTRLESAYLTASLNDTRKCKAGFQPLPDHYTDEQNTLMLGYSLMRCTHVLAHFARYDAHLGRRFERAIQQIAKLRESNGNRAHPTPEVSAAQPLHEAAQTPASENCETNPIPPNQSGINKIAPASPPQPHSTQPETNPNTPEPIAVRPSETRIPPVNGSASPQNPLLR